MTRDRPDGPHPLLDEAAGRLGRGEISRRDFVRTAALLGVSLPAAGALAGLGVVRGKSAEAAAPRRGGDLRVSMNVMAMGDPATYDWSEKGNLARHMTEPLVRINRNNVAEPYLAESWRASDDLKTWTFKLRRGVKWSNGDDFGADDVVANFRRWLDPRTGSSNQGRFAAMTRSVDTGRKDKEGKPIRSTVASEGAVERIDDHTVRFHLARPDLALPESMADYPALIVHRRFAEEGGDLSKNPVGTGPFTLTGFRVGEKAELTRRTDAQWWGGAVYLERILYIDHGDDPAAQIAALASRQVDASHKISVEQIDVVKSIPHLRLHRTVTAQCGVARMRVTEKPFDNKQLRQAIQACVDHDKMLAVVFRGLGAPGEDHHVAPIHPEYAKLPKTRPDYARARALLRQAGYADGIKLRIDCVANPAWEQNACKALAEMLKPAGIDLAINIMPGATYWDRWMSTPFGFTSWTHRALGVQVLNLAYRSGVAWNETAYANPAFDRLLDQAGALADPNPRREIMARLERTLQDDSVISQASWRSVFVAADKRVRGLYAQVALEHHYNGVWLE